MFTFHIHSNYDKVYDRMGFLAKIYPTKTWVRISQKAKYITLILYSGYFNKKDIRDTLTIAKGSCFYEKDYFYHGYGKYFFEADFTGDKDIKTAYIFNIRNKPHKRKYITILSQGKKYRLKTDYDGRIFIKSPTNP